ncbi:MAG: agmatine deiminase family protein [Candidatus Kapabacteria bacterium]|nr:agmatine deiminase family protein [Candidatus Kapabacteria bacterium]
MRRYFTPLLAALVLLSAVTLFGETNPNEAKQKAIQKLKSLKPDEFLKLHKPKRPSEENLLIYKEAAKLIAPKGDNRLQSKEEFKMDSLPPSFRVPGEFEESQAVLVSWPSYAYDAKGNFVEPFTPGVGVKFKETGGFELVEIVGYELDLFEDSPFPILWAELIDAIQYECTAWIRVANLEDTVKLHEYMNSIGKPLYNYEFLSDPDGENAFWTRDFGPYGAYDNSNDSLFFINAQYYPIRPIDNDYPELLASNKGYKFFSSQLETEGGNIIADGKGTAFFGDVIYWNNADSVGPGLVIKERWSTDRTREEMTKVFNLKNRHILNSLNCDGGTGHLDIYLKLIDDETFIITKFPDKYNSVNFPDYALINNNRKAISELKSVHNTPYKFLELPLPTDDNGTQNRVRCETFQQDARGFINGLIVNKSFIFPSYSDDIDGNSQQTQEVVELLKSYLPGYRIVPIDSRVLSPLGGALHCITMQIPADKPVYIKHKAIRGTVSTKAPYEIAAVVEHSDSLVKVNCHWRIKDQPVWFIASMQALDSLYVGFIANGVQDGLEIEYYLQAETVNGKIVNYPITAPDGYFGFKYMDPASVADFTGVEIAISPNPASEYIEINNNPTVNRSVDEVSEIKIYNKLGECVSNHPPTGSGSGNLRIDISHLSAGVYYLRIGNRTEMFVKI